MAVRIWNKGLYPFTLPSPVSGFLLPGEAGVINATIAEVEAVLGGASRVAKAGLELREVPGEVTSHNDMPIIWDFEVRTEVTGLDGTRLDSTLQEIVGKFAGKVAVTFTLAELQALAGGSTSVTKTVETLPANARLLGMRFKLAGAAYEAPAVPAYLTVFIRTADGAKAMGRALPDPTALAAGVEGAIFDTDMRAIWGGNPRVILAVQDAAFADIDLSTLTAGSTLTVELFYLPID